MAQRFLGSDTIGSLSQGSGTFTLAASRLTIGGQQYKTSALSVTPTLAANTMYCLYVVLSSGVLTLVSSTNVNSVGPAGFSSWKLVGAYVTNYLSAFTRFLPIEGIVTLSLTVYQGPGVTINQNVNGFLDTTSNTDPYGINVPNAGAYTSASGTFATRNPSIVNPIPGATVTFDVTMGWTGSGVNSANTWNNFIFRNGSSTISTAINGAGANAGGLNFLQCPLSGEVIDQAAGDFYSIKALNDQAAIVTFIRNASIEIIAPKQIKDM